MLEVLKLGLMSTKGINFYKRYTYEQRLFQVKIEILLKNYTIKEIMKLTGWCEETVKSRKNSLTKPLKKTKVSTEKG